MATSAPPHDLNCLSLVDLEQLAHARMDINTRSYYNEGADNGSTLAENITAYQKYRIRPRVLRDITHIDTSAELFGFKSAVPIAVAPTAMQKLAHYEGELATARACKKQKIVMGLSSFATSTLEEVASALEGTPHVLQLYLFEDREHSKKLIARAKAAGYKAVFLTVDTPMLGRRNLEIRSQFKLPKNLKIANFEESPNSDAVAAVMTGTQSGSDVNAQSSAKRSTAGYTDGDRRVAPTGPITFHSHAANPSLNWEKDIAWLKEQCGDMQVWLKGVATSEDALMAVKYGVNGIVVSNHGGRQLNGALATLDALPEIATAVKGQIPIHIDGGIRHGSDAFKAIALGADYVWIGRPALWGLAYKGQEGVELCLRLLEDEFKLCMGLAGAVKVSDINSDYLVRMGTDGQVHRIAKF